MANDDRTVGIIRTPASPAGSGIPTSMDSIGRGDATSIEGHTVVLTESADEIRKGNS